MSSNLTVPAAPGESKASAESPCSELVLIDWETLLLRKCPLTYISLTYYSPNGHFCVKIHNLLIYKFVRFNLTILAYMFMYWYNYNIYQWNFEEIKEVTHWQPIEPPEG